MRIHNAPVTLLSTVGDFIVSGGEDGYVRFFDPLLRIVAWFEDLGAGGCEGGPERCHVSMLPVWCSRSCRALMSITAAI